MEKMTTDFSDLKAKAEKATAGKREARRTTGHYDIGIRVRGPVVSGYMAFLGCKSWHHEAQQLEQIANAEFIAACDRETILSILGQLEAMRAENVKLRDALTTVREWEFPRTLRTWDDGTEMSYGAAFGSQGEQHYMQKIASDALATSQEDKEK